eukprot:9901331-Lingulodinium_polyedra.AAC.1
MPTNNHTLLAGLLTRLLATTMARSLACLIACLLAWLIAALDRGYWFLAHLGVAATRPANTCTHCH